MIVDAEQCPGEDEDFAEVYQHGVHSCPGSYIMVNVARELVMIARVMASVPPGERHEFSAIYAVCHRKLVTLR